MSVETSEPTWRSQQCVRLASALCYVRCIMLALSVADLGAGTWTAWKTVRPTAAGVGFVVTLVYAAIAIVFGVAGNSLRRRRRNGVKLALALASIGVVFGSIVIAASVILFARGTLGHLDSSKEVVSTLIHAVSFTVNVLIVVLIAASWKYLDQHPPSEGPTAAV